MLRFACPHCHRPLSAPPEAAGRSSRCTGCRGSLTIPFPEAQAPAEEMVPAGGATARSGPSLLAAPLWMAVAILALVTCAGGCLAGYFIFTVPLPEAASAYGSGARLVALFPVVVFLLIPAYILARAFDRLTQ